MVLPTMSFMSKGTWGYVVIAVLVVVLSGCRSTQFVQGSGDPDRFGQVQCSTAPGEFVYAESAMQVMLTGAITYNGRMEQTISGPEPSKIYLIKKAGETTFSREDGTDNVFTFQKEGKYQAEFTGIDYGADLKATCNFEVIRECPVGQDREGLNVVIVIDNSNSNGLSDCGLDYADPPQRQCLNCGSDPSAQQPAVPLYQCLVKTNREKTVSSVAKMLKDLETQEDAVSHVSFAYFPTMGTATFTPRWYTASGEALFSSNDLDVLRRPNGTTPYLEGLEAAKSLFSQMPAGTESKGKVVVFITDGFPTDKDPDAVLKLASDLKATGVQIVSVIVTQLSHQGVLRQKHRQFMMGFDERWPKDEVYFSKLLGNGADQKGLLHSMSTWVSYLEEASSLPQEVNKLVSAEAVKCR